MSMYVSCLAEQGNEMHQCCFVATTLVHQLDVTRQAIARSRRESGSHAAEYGVHRSRCGGTVAAVTQVVLHELGGLAGTGVQGALILLSTQEQAIVGEPSVFERRHDRILTLSSTLMPVMCQ